MKGYYYLTEISLINIPCYGFYMKEDIGTEESPSVHSQGSVHGLLFLQKQAHRMKGMGAAPLFTEVLFFEEEIIAASQ